MILLRIDDVGRLESDTPENGSDGSLRFFREWRRAAGLEGLPAVYGCVPNWIDDEGRDYLATLNPAAGELIAVHGISHARGEEPSAAELLWARTRLLDARCYIPPFNDYTEETLKNWKLAGGKYFLGGFPSQHHRYGVGPMLVAGVTHLPADPFLYGRSGEILENLDRPSSSGHRVLTLHVPWETNPAPLRRLIERIKPQLLTPEQAAVGRTFFSGV